MWFCIFLIAGRCFLKPSALEPQRCESIHPHTHAGSKMNWAQPKGSRHICVHKMLFRRGLWCHLLNLERTAVRRALSFLECHLVSCLPGIWAVLCLTSCKLLSFSHDKSIAWLLSDVYCLIFQFSPCWSLCISGNTVKSFFCYPLSASFESFP